MFDQGQVAPLEAGDYTGALIWDVAGAGNCQISIWESVALWRAQL
jgi:hypothetical protein